MHGPLNYYRLGASYPRTSLRQPYAQKRKSVNPALLTSGTATQTYNEAMSGGILLGTTFPEQHIPSVHIYDETMLGGISLNGTWASSWIYNFESAGGLQVNGTPTFAFTYNPFTSAGILVSGIGEITRFAYHYMSGGVSLAGSVVANLIYAEFVSGGILLSGIADVALGKTYNETMLGGLLASGVVQHNLNDIIEVGGGLQLNGVVVPSFFLTNLVMTGGTKTGGAHDVEFLMIPPVDGGISTAGTWEHNMIIQEYALDGVVLDGEVFVNGKVTQYVDGGVLVIGYTYRTNDILMLGGLVYGGAAVQTQGSIRFVPIIVQEVASRVAEEKCEPYTVPTPEPQQGIMSVNMFRYILAEPPTPTISKESRIPRAPQPGFSAVVIQNVEEPVEEEKCVLDVPATPEPSRGTKSVGITRAVPVRTPKSKRPRETRIPREPQRGKSQVVIKGS